MDKKSFVYIWTNKINNKKYLGSHYGFEDDGYIGSGIAFKAAIKRYGLCNFEREIIEYTSISDRLIREQYWLDFYDVSTNPLFYNISGSASGGRTMEGKTDDELQIWRETCRVSQLNRDYTPTDDARKKMSEASRKYWDSLTKEERSAMFSKEKNPMFGKKRIMSEETKAKMKISQKARFTKEEEKIKVSIPGHLQKTAKSVIINGIKYRTIKEAHLATKISKYKIRQIWEKQNNENE